MASTISARAKFQVVGFLVALDLVELRLFRRHQQLKHEQAAILAVQIVGQPLQSGRLPAVQGPIALRVVAHQHLAKGRVKGFDVLGEILAVFEFELLLPALLGGAGGDIAIALTASRRMAAPNCSSTRMPAFSLGTPRRNRSLEAVVDHLLGGGDLRRLLRS